MSISNLINLITFSRIILAPFILIFLISGNYLICLLAFFLAGFSDYLDGYLARKFQAQSEIGEILDPIADKILVVFILFGLTVNLHSYLIAFLGSLIISREVAIAALRDYASRNNMSAKIQVTYIAKTKTTFQFLSIFLYLFALSFKFNLLIIISDILLIITTILTIYSGYQYLMNFQKR